MAKHARGLARARKKGFSLVELIIVVAIMVALVAAMAPAFVKYVNKSHDAVVEAAAESVLQFVKAEVSDGSLTGEGKILVGRDTLNNNPNSKNINIEWVANDDGVLNIQYTAEGATGDGKGKFIQNCGVDDTKPIKSNLLYEIVLYNDYVSGHPNPQARMNPIDPDNS